MNYRINKFLVYGQNMCMKIGAALQITYRLTWPTERLLLAPGPPTDFRNFRYVSQRRMTVNFLLFPSAVVHWCLSVRLGENNLKKKSTY